MTGLSFDRDREVEEAIERAGRPSASDEAGPADSGEDRERPDIFSVLGFFRINH